MATKRETPSALVQRVTSAFNRVLEKHPRIRKKLKFDYGYRVESEGGDVRSDLMVFMGAYNLGLVLVEGESIFRLIQRREGNRVFFEEEGHRLEAGARKLLESFCSENFWIKWLRECNKRKK